MHLSSGDILFERCSRNRTAGESLLYWLYPLHSGTAFGAAGEIAMCITGLAMLLVFPTGLWVWMSKRRAQPFEAARRHRLSSHADVAGESMP